MNYYPHHIGDYVKDTAHLSMLEDGAYRRMMDIYYSTEKPLPLDRAALYRLLRVSSKAEKAAVNVVLSEFFLEKVDGWHHGRCDEEIARAKEKSQKASDSARKRWGEGNANADSNAMQTHSEGNAPNNQEPITKEKHSPPDGFSRFWDSWPPTTRKQGRGKCLQLWNRLKCEAIADEIVAHVEAMKLTEGWRTGFDPMPSTYLNQRRWDGATLPTAEPRQVAI